MLQHKQQELLAEAQNLEFERMIAEAMADIKASTEAIKAQRMALTGEQPAEPANVPVKPKATSLMPRVIAGRRAA